MQVDPRVQVDPRATRIAATVVVAVAVTVAALILAVVLARGAGPLSALAEPSRFAAQIVPPAAAAPLAAILTAAFGLCLGCEMYLLTRRLLPAATR
jgi:hypothetical protein